MVMILVAVLFTTILMVGGTIWIHFGPLISENWLGIAAALVALLGVGLYRLGAFESPAEPLSPPEPEPKTPQPETAASIGEADGWTKVRENPDGIGVLWELADDSPFERASGADLSEVEFLRRRLQEELRAKWQALQLALDENTCRLVGRVVRIDRKSEEAAYGSIWLAIPDAEEGGHQAIRLHGAFTDLVQVAATDRVTLLASWRRGHLRWLEVEDRAACTEPMPEVTLPEPKPKDPAGKNDGQLPTMAELEKATSGDGWGSLNHCRFRAPMAWHLTTSPKYRAKSFAGRAAEVQAILREVAEAEGFDVIAIAAESDHVHLLGLPKGRGGMPPNWTWSRWVGRWKALTSKKLKALPGLEDFQWQVGYALTSVNGGKQGAEAALEVVRAYVEAQGHQDDPEDALDEPDGESEVAT